MAEDHGETGMATRRAVLGDAHVDAAEARTTAFDAPFQALITEAAWGQVWSRPEMSHRERSLLTMALLAALGHEEEFAMHVGASTRLGVRPEELREALLHVAVYAGVPAANRAFRAARAAYARAGIEV